MTPERFRQVCAVFEEVLEGSRGGRAAALGDLCGPDTELAREAKRMLEAAGDSRCVLDRPAGERASGIAETSDSARPGPPDQMGRYRLLRVLGEGGMGTVYEAEQEQPRRTVALKILRPGSATPALLRRFELEAEALGRLQHPGIAQIHEAGTAESGGGPQPYFAMELIQGTSLLAYAVKHHLTVRQRLELLTKVCDAVHHAHQRGLIHRDLKPGNILVEESGQPKVLDFGVARVTDRDTQATRQTEVGQIVGTLAYMSPEQVLGDPQELDTRSDVYALGVILFELLAGGLPYRIDGPWYEAVHTIREEEPVRLSSINRTYRGDLETIVAKALEKDRDRRYASAADLAADLRRYLQEEPILARPPSTTYQLHKFARRHKTLAAAVAAVFVVLLAGIVTSSWEARRAETEAASERAIIEFLQNDLLGQASASNQAHPDTRPDPNLTVRTALDRAAARMAGKFKKEPFLEVSLRQTMGKTYRDLGLYSEAQQQLERALALGAEIRGEEHPDNLGILDDLAQVYHYQGKYALAERLYARTLALEQRRLGQDHPDTRATLNNLGSCYQEEGKYREAEALFGQALQLGRRFVGQQDPYLLTVKHNLASLYWHQGKYAQAEPLLAEVLATKRRVLGEEHPDTLTTMNVLAATYSYEAKYEQAEALQNKVVEARKRVLGEAHAATLSSMHGLAVLYRDEGKYAPAEALFRKVLEAKRRVLGPQHPDTLSTLYALGFLYLKQGHYAEADRFIREVVTSRQRLLPKGHADTLLSMNTLGRIYYHEGRYREGEQLLREEMGTFRNSTVDTWLRYDCESLLGANLAAQKKYAEAEGLLLSGHEGLEQRRATIPASSRCNLEESRSRIVQLYQDWGKPDKAAEWERKPRGAQTE